MVSLDTFNDNVFLWSCTAVPRGARADRSTEATRELAKRIVPNNFPRTSKFTMATRFERASHELVISNDTKKSTHEEEHLFIVQTRESKRRRQFMRERSTAKLKLQHHRSAGLSAQASC